MRGTPLEVVHRLRLIGASSLHCLMIVSFDSHRLTIIAADGQDIIPVTNDSLVIYSGESVLIYWVSERQGILC